MGECVSTIFNVRPERGRIQESAQGSQNTVKTPQKRKFLKSCREEGELEGGITPMRKKVATSLSG